MALLCFMISRLFFNFQQSYSSKKKGRGRNRRVPTPLTLFSARYNSRDDHCSRIQPISYSQTHKWHHLELYSRFCRFHATSSLYYTPTSEESSNWWHLTNKNIDRNQRNFNLSTNFPSSFFFLFWSLPVQNFKRNSEKWSLPPITPNPLSCWYSDEEKRYQIWNSIMLSKLYEWNYFIDDNRKLYALLEVTWHFWNPITYLISAFLRGFNQKFHFLIVVDGELISSTIFR